MRIVLALLLFVSTTAAAATAPVDATPVPTDGWSLYDEAFALAAAGRDADALALVDRLESEFPDGAPAMLGAELARLLRSKRAGAVAPMNEATRQLFTSRLAPPVPVAEAPTKHRPLAEELRDEQPSGVARAELIFFQTLDGISLGLELCAIAECTGTQPVVLSTMLGGVAGLGLSVLLTGNGITAGHALALDSGAAWGAWQGLALWNILELDGRAPPTTLFATQLAGLGLGELVWRTLPVGAGDVSLANSGGIWTGLFTMFLTLAALPHISSQAGYGVLLASSDVGLVGGALLSRVLPMSRGRALVLDAGGILGMLLGFGLDELAQGGNTSNGAFFSLGAVGIAAGIGASAYFTRHWDLDDLPVALGVAPTNGGAMLTMNAAL